MEIIFREKLSKKLNYSQCCLCITLSDLMYYFVALGIAETTKVRKGLHKGAQRTF